MARTVSRTLFDVLLFAVLFSSLSLWAADSENSLLISVRQEGKSGYINTQGKVVIDFQFEGASYFSEGLAMVRRQDKCGYIDRSGKLVIPYQRCYLFEEFDEGLAVVSYSRRGKRRYINTQGKVLSGAAFAFAEDFSEGLAAVKPRWEGKCCWGYIGKGGRFVIPPQFEDFAGSFSEGVADVRLGGKVGFINKQGEFLIPPKFERAEGFREGLAPVRLNGKWGFINHDSKFVIPPQFEYARSFSDGLAAACVEAYKCGHVNRQGEWIVPPKYKQSHPFRDGYAEVVDVYVGFVDTSGKEILPVEYSEGGYIGEGWFRVLTTNEQGMAEWRVMDVHGKVLFREDARDFRCLHQNPPFPSEDQVSVTLTPAQATVRAGATIPFEVKTAGFRRSFFFDWGTQDVANHGAAHRCSSFPGSVARFDSCPFGYLGESKGKPHGGNAHLSATYHAPNNPGTYYLYVYALDPEGCNSFREIRRWITAEIKVTP
jgi:hypothetical protein